MFPLFAAEIIARQMYLFHRCYKKIPTNKRTRKYREGDLVVLVQGTMLHGISGGVDHLMTYALEGIVSRDFRRSSCSGRFPYCVSFWVIRERTLLRDYIRTYSGATLSLIYGDKNAPTQVKTILCQTDSIASLVNDDQVTSWKAEQTKEIRFLPNLVNGQRQIAFIIDTSGPLAEELLKADIFSDEFPSSKRKFFVARKYRKSFSLFKQDALFTNRENAVVYGIPSCLIEGIIVGRTTEADSSALKEIQKAFPWCYIANIDGVVIKG